MTYEYACAACGHEWEAEQSIRDAPLKKCPHCGKNQAKRQISRGAGFILKGGGWYADGYGSSSSSSGSKGSPSSGEKSESPKKPSSDSASDGGTSGEKPSGSGDSKGKTAAA
jgi:putative FmdB family regulatory protein